MKKEEITKEMKLTYLELVEYLKDKYGSAKYDYFCNETCRSVNHRNTRTSEGLILHHIDEDKAIMLTNSRFAKIKPYEFQKADRLVYCNYIEHLILHIKISEEPRHKDAYPADLPGIGGAVNFIVKELNDYYMGYPFSQEWRKKLFSMVEENYDDYIHLLKYLLKIIENNPVYNTRFNIDTLCKGDQLRNYPKIKKAILDN